MTDLYAALGVDKTADRATIRKAYRRKAKSAHPDAGGSKSQFALVKLAHDVLTDDARRQRYESTGDASEAQPDNALSEAIQCVSMALDMALGEVRKRGREAHQTDLAKEVRAQLQARLSKVREEINAIKVAVGINEKLVGRFKKNGEGGVMEQMIAARIGDLHRRLEQDDRQIAALKRALEMLDGYSFKADPASTREESPFVRFMYMGGS